MGMSFWGGTFKGESGEPFIVAAQLPTNIFLSDGSTYAFESDSILARARELSPEVRRQEPEVLAAFAGLRPSRDGGARVQRDHVTVNDQKLPLVHNYGAGGTGFQAGYGMAVDSVATVDHLLRKLRLDSTRARL